MTWSAPSTALSTRIRSSILKSIWGTGSKLRCPEIVLGILNDPTRVDNFSSAAYRALLDARRTLRKSQERRDRFIEALNLYQRGSKLNGPAHGIMEYAQALGIEIVITETEIMLETPIGYSIDLCTDHLSHFRYVITEVCRFAILKQLKERSETLNVQEHEEAKSKQKKGRKDMEGITADIDVRATLAMLNCRKDPKYDDEEGQDAYYLHKLHELDEAQKILCRPCKLSPVSRRRLQTIIAGSIRPPHRLVYTGRIEDSLCKHPACQNEKCDTHHIFWK